MSKNTLSLTAKDGGNFTAYIARPDGEKAAAPAVIVIQEIFGINQELRDKCDDLAAQGYLAICPDLFWRIEPGIELVDSEPDQLQRAFDLFGQFDVEQGVADLMATLEQVRALPECNGKVGAVGYCLGGKLAYLMATESDIDASVSYYGVGLGDMLDKAPQIKAPFMLHIAGDDAFTPPEEQDKIQRALDENPKASVYHYAGMEHAFARGNGMHYNEDAASIANRRTADLLASALK